MKITLDIAQPDLEKLIAPAMIRRILYTYADALDIDLFSCGSATCKSQSTNRGLEPDESFCIGDRKQFPDLAIEVTVTSGGINKLEIYQGLQIPEVWFYQSNHFSLYRIKQDGSGYQEITQSQFLPNLDLNLMAQYIRPDLEPEMVKAWRKFINNSK